MTTNKPHRRRKSINEISQPTTSHDESMPEKSQFPLNVPRSSTVSSSSSSSSSRGSDSMDWPKTTSAASVISSGALPAVLTWGLTLGLIFGGCCSNVFALEAIVKDEPDSGLLITLAQFLTISTLTLPSHIDFSSSPNILKKRAIPIAHWIPAIAMFFSVNMLNNYAFGFSISVPIHIILRSGGSVTTMVIGYIWGKKYNRGQVLGVTMLTIGVIIAALSDAQSKGNINTSSSGSTSSFLAGLTILFIGQIISAIMGLYIQYTYAKYGPHWHENLFYSHFLSLPLFLPILPSLIAQLQKLLLSPPITFTIPTGSRFYSADSEVHGWKSSLESIWQQPPRNVSTPSFQVSVPVQMINLGVNALTQYACIRGVNLLATRTTALGVTIVLNVRKLISLFLSIWLFGNTLPKGVELGAAVVFAGAAVYAWSGQPRSKPPELHNEAEKEKSKAG